MRPQDDSLSPRAKIWLWFHFSDLDFKSKKKKRMGRSGRDCETTRYTSRVAAFRVIMELDCCCCGGRRLSQMCWSFHANSFKLSHWPAPIRHRWPGRIVVAKSGRPQSLKPVAGRQNIIINISYPLPRERKLAPTEQLPNFTTLHKTSIV